MIAKAVRKGHRVVVVNVASDYSTWRVTQGREEEVKERVLGKAAEIGVEKRFLGYGYRQAPRDIGAIKKLATAAFRGWQCGARYAEACMSLDKRAVGHRLLREIVLWAEWPARMLGADSLPLRPDCEELVRGACMKLLDELHAAGSS